MAYETLEETRKWLEEQEEKVGITYSDKISHMTLSNSGSRPNYEVMAKMLCEDFSEWAGQIDSMIEAHGK